MEKTEQIWRAEQYMKEVHQYDASGHDVAHVYRVVSWRSISQIKKMRQWIPM